jgi:phosphate transport system ATP-binding protein
LQATFIQEDEMPSNIDIQGLSVAYNNTVVVQDVDLSFPAGKVTAIIGPSGCGKTTLLRCINRLSEMTAGCRVKGTIYVDGNDIFRMDPMLLRRRVGMVFQKPNPFPKSIKENILYGLKAARTKCDYQSVIESSLSKAALWEEAKDRLNDSAFSLSLGQQQRLCIARCLAVSPGVILMDEPAASLDPTSTSRVEESIIAMKNEYTVVIITHNMQQALKVSDYTAFMDKGRLIEFGETTKLFEQPDRKETRDYILGGISELISHFPQLMRLTGGAVDMNQDNSVEITA